MLEENVDPWNPTYDHVWSSLKNVLGHPFLNQKLGNKIAL